MVDIGPVSLQSVVDAVVPMIEPQAVRKTFASSKRRSPTQW